LEAWEGGKSDGGVGGDGRIRELVSVTRAGKLTIAKNN